MNEHEKNCLELAERVIAGMSFEEKEISLLNWIYCELQLNPNYFEEIKETFKEG